MCEAYFFMADSFISWRTVSLKVLWLGDTDWFRCRKALLFGCSFEGEGDSFVVEPLVVFTRPWSRYALTTLTMLRNRFFLVHSDCRSSNFVVL